jgi:hypothetical protein
MFNSLAKSSRNQQSDECGSRATFIKISLLEDLDEILAATMGQLTARWASLPVSQTELAFRLERE